MVLFRQGLAVLLISVLMTISARGQTPVATPTVSPSPLAEPRTAGSRLASNYVNVATLFYDTEGRVGIGGPHAEPYVDWIEYQFAGEEPVRVDTSGGITEPTPHAVGTPFAFIIHGPTFEPVRGFNRVRPGYDVVWFVIPVKSSETPLKIEVEDYNPSQNPEMGVWCDFWSGDSKAFPAPATDYYPNPASSTFTVKAEYLPGNALEAIGEESHTFATGSVDLSHKPSVYWSSLAISYPDTYVFRPEVPVGELVLRIGAVGWGDDSVRFAASSEKAYHWRPLLVPEPAGSIAAWAGIDTLTQGEGEFIQEIGIREDLLKISQTTTNLLKVSDVNGDGCIDAADYQRLQGSNGR